MRKLLFKWVKEKKARYVSVDMFTMRTDPRRGFVENRIVTKSYANNIFDKRYINPDLLDSTVTTVPFGAKHANFADVWC